MRLCVSADALFVDSVVGVSQQDVGEAGLQQVHGEEGRLLHDLKHSRQHRRLYIYSNNNHNDDNTQTPRREILQREEELGESNTVDKLSTFQDKLYSYFCTSQHQFSW